MQLQDLTIVLKIAEFRSITAAATHLDIRVATASAALKRVEKQLGSELFVRSTRQLRVSSAGERYLPHCEQALQLLEQAKHNLQEDTDSIEGELRITLSSDLGRNLIIPWLDEFMDEYPKVSLKAHITDSNVDFYRDSVDIALRYGPPSEANLYGFKLCDIPGLLCASPAYLQQHGIPQHPHDLRQHNGLFYQLYDKTYDLWEFSDGKHNYKIKMRGNRASNDGDLVRRWCVAGKGLAVKSCLDISADLRAGRVVKVLADYQPRSTELWLIFPNRQAITPATRLLRDWLQEKVSAILAQKSL